MNDELTPIAAAPADVADAIALHARLGALADWTSERKRAVAGWVEGKAHRRLTEDGAAPTWRTDVGNALLTDPKAKVTVDDVEAFARWYVREVRDDDPDRPGDFVDYERALRQRVATVAKNDVLEFIDRYPDDAMAAAHRLAASIVVTWRWTLSDKLLDDLLTEPRILVDQETLAAIDLHTGEVVPGIRVAPPARRAVQMRPTPTVKRQVRDELDRLLGPSELPTP